MKKEVRDKLIKGFRERFKDYSEPVSDDVWSSLEKELSPVHVVSVHPFRKIAVAAAVLIVVAPFTLKSSSTGPKAPAVP